MHPFNPQPRVAGALIALLGLLPLTGSLPARAAGFGADAHVSYAEVVAATPRYGWTEVSEPVRHCEAVTVAGRGDAYYRDDRSRRHDAYRAHHYRDEPPSAAAGLVGGLIGGVIGNQFGGGNGRTALTLVGAAVGASIAQDHVRRSRHRQRGYREYPPLREGHRVVRRCSESVQSRRVRGVQGYDVTYRYQGRTFHKFVNEHPGDTVRVHVEVEPLDGVAAR